MQRFYFILIDERDNEKFRAFRIGKFSRNIIKSLGLEENGRIWGIPYQVSKDIWNEIKRNDIVFFGENNLTIKYYGKIHKKIINRSLSKLLWSSSPRTKLIDRFLLFNNINETTIDFHEILRYCGLRIDSETFSGMYKIKDNFVSEVSQHITEKKEKPSKSKTRIIIPADYAGAPGKDIGTVTRFIRDTAKSRLLKKKYKDKCQVCNYRIQITKTTYYSEVHHILPLKEGGADNFNNMIVLCPTHHAEFDYGVIGISDDCKDIIDKNGEKIGTLTLQSDHKLDKNNIKFHLEMMKEN